MTHDDDLKELYIRNIEALYWKAYRMGDEKNLGGLEHLKVLLHLGVEEIKNPEGLLYFERAEYRSHVGDVTTKYVRTAEHRHAPVLLSVCHAYASKLFYEASDLWHSLHNLPSVAPDSAREILREAATELGRRGRLIMDGLGVDTDMYPVDCNDLERAQATRHLAERLAKIANAMEYENVILKDVKL